MEFRSFAAKAAINAAISPVSTKGMSPRRMSAPSQSAGSAANPARRDVLKPAAKSELWTQATSKPRKASAMRLAWNPVTTTMGLATLASATSATRAMTAIPPIVSMSLLHGAMRVERPAARITPATAIIGLSPGNGRDFGNDRERDLGRPLCADVESDRRMNAGDCVASDARFDQAHHAGRVRHLAAERPNIERLRLKRMDQARIIDPGIVADRDQCRAGIDADIGQGLVGPFANQLDASEPFLGREGMARIDNDHIVVERTRHRGERLGDMGGTGDDEACPRVEHIYEDVAVFARGNEALVAAERLFKKGR